MPETYCPKCGDSLDGEQDCPACGIEHPSTARLRDLLDTAEKSWRFGERLARSFPPLAILIAYRQRDSENAQHELLAYRDRLEPPVHCRSCGGELPSEAASCPDCGRENELAAIEAIDVVVNDPADAHDPAHYETDVSGNWWYGIVAEPVLVSLPVVVGFSAAAVVRYLVLALWVVGAVVGIVSPMYDRKYVRANGTWHPSAAWAGLLWFPGVALVAAAVYLGKRLSALGVDDHRFSSRHS